MNDWISQAIKQSQKSKEPIKCGVVIIKDGKVIAKTFNSQRSSNDPTAHGEINALRKAAKKLKSKNLDGCEIYCSCEPCLMCLTAISFAKIEKVYYHQSLKDLSQKDKLINISSQEFISKSPYKLQLIKS